MSRPFGMVIESVLRRPGSLDLLTVIGPTIGGTPERKQRLIVRGAFGTPSAVTYLGPEMAISGAPMKPAIVIRSDVLHPGYLRGATLSEDGVLWRTFGAVFKARTARGVHAMRFDLRDGRRTFGLAHLEGRIVAAIVLGGVLASDEDLWAELATMTTPDGLTVRLDELNVIGSGWPVAAWPAPYDRNGRGTLMTRPCGPAEPGRAVLISGARVQRASVLAQQGNGMIQVDAQDAVDSVQFIVQEAA